jgi:hypothetical protein
MKKVVLLALAITLVLLLLVAVFSLTVATSRSIRGEGYTTASLLGLLVVIEAIVAAGFLIRTVVRGVRKSRT